MTRLLVATPIHGASPETATVAYGWHRFVLELTARYDARPLPVDLAYCTDVGRARNRIVGHVLRESSLADFTHVLWLDSDQWAEDPGGVERMIACGEDFVAAPYTNRRHPVRWVHRRPVDGAEERGPLIEAEAVGFGFALTSRACLERMDREGGAERYVDLPHVKHVVADLFDQPKAFVGGLWTKESEDFGFCRRWRSIGGRIWLHRGVGLVPHLGGRAYSAADVG